MRLIDADKLIRDIEDYHLSDGMFQHWIELQPTIESFAQPEIIRCKDCYHYPGEYTDCPMIGWFRNGNDFCSRAERRTDD